MSETESAKGAAMEERYGKMVDEYLAEIRAVFMQMYAPLVATGEWRAEKESCVASNDAAMELADIVFRGERIRNEQPIR